MVYNNSRLILLAIAIVTLVNLMNLLLLDQEDSQASHEKILTPHDVSRKLQLTKVHRKASNISGLYTHRSLTHLSASELEIILYSAVATNSTTDETWDVIAAQGWIVGNVGRKPNYICCIRHKSGILRLHRRFGLEHWIVYQQVEHSAWQFQCKVDDKNKQDLAMKIAIMPAIGRPPYFCPTDIKYYTDIEYTYRHNGTAIFLKVLYSNLSSDDLLTWFEVHKLFGVQKVLAYVIDDLNLKAKTVLNHYKESGLLDVLHYLIPGKVPTMYTDLPACWNLKGVSFFDGQIRLKGYDYMISIDPDEFLIPTLNENYNSVFDRMIEERPIAAGFLFKTFLFIKDWGIQEHSRFSIGKYLNRSGPTEDRVKHVTIPSRVRLGGVRTMNFEAATGYRPYKADINDIAVYHFRECREEWKSSDSGGDGGLDCLRMERFKDRIAFNLLRAIETNVFSIKVMYDI